VCVKLLVNFIERRESVKQFVTIVIILELVLLLDALLAASYRTTCPLTVVVFFYRAMVMARVEAAPTSSVSWDRCLEASVR
jgi:Na+-transporting NADH:ubiquinone oxidoreductase subunit NqrD